MPTSIRRTDPAIAAQVTADLHTLPTGRIVARNQVAHIFTADINDLLVWLTALGGHITRQHSSLGITLWTLHTHTGPRADGSRTTVLVHASTLTDESTDHALTDAVA